MEERGALRSHHPINTLHNSITRQFLSSAWYDVGTMLYNVITNDGLSFLGSRYIFNIVNQPLITVKSSPATRTFPALSPIAPVDSWLIIKPCIYDMEVVSRSF